MKMFIFILIILLLCGCTEGDTLIGMDRLNLSQSIDGIKFSGTSPSTTIGVLYSDAGTLKFNGSAVSNEAEVTVGPENWCDYVTDGTDDYVTFNQAFTYAAANNISVVDVTVGNYSLGAGQVVIPPNMWLRGPNWPIYTTRQVDLSVANEARFSITYTGAEAFLLDNGSAISDCQFFYPNNLLTGPAAVYHPATIKIKDYSGGAEVFRVHPMNPYYFLNQTGPNGYGIRLQIHDVIGYFTKRGILITSSVHCDEISRVHFLPGFSGLPLGDPIYNDVAVNGIAFQIMRSDGIRITDCQLWDIGYGIYMPGTSAVQVNGAIIDGCGFDETPHPFYASWAVNMEITNFNTMATSGSWSKGVHYTTTSTDYNSIELVDCDAVMISGGLHSTSQHVVLCTRSNTSISGLAITGWGFASGGVAAIQLHDANTAASANSICRNVLKSGGGVGGIGIGINNCKHVVIEGNVGIATQYSLAINNAASDYYIYQGNSIVSSSGVYNDAGGAAHQVIADNLDT